MFITLYNLYIPEINENPGGAAFYTDDPELPFKWHMNFKSYAAAVEWTKNQDWKLIQYANGNMVTK